MKALIFSLAAILAAADASAEDAFQYDWEAGGCAQPIKSFIEGAKVHDIFRLRPRVSESTATRIVIEEGDPNRPNEDTRLPTWDIRMGISRGQQKALTAAMRKGAWVVFTANGSPYEPEIDQQLFYVDGRACMSNGPTDAAGKSILPPEVARFFRSALDVGSNEPEMITTLFGGENPGEPNAPSPKPKAVQSKSEADEAVAAQSSYPPPLQDALDAVFDACMSSGYQWSQMDKDFVTRVDINGDGKQDWIADGHKIWCMNGAKRSPAAGGPDGSSLWIVLDTPSGPQILDQIIQTDGVIRRHVNFATISFDNGGDMQIRGTKITDIKRVPPGGTVVFTMRK